MRKAVADYFYPEVPSSNNADDMNVQANQDDPISSREGSIQADSTERTSLLGKPGDAYDVDEEFTHQDRKHYISTLHAVVDYTLGHLATNAIAGPTFFALMNQWSPDVATKIFGFFQNTLGLGENTPIILPIAINVVPLCLAALESGVRYKTGSLQKKEDALVHTPFYKISAFDRKLIAFTFFVATALQVNNGVTRVYPDFEGSKVDAVSQGFFNTSLAAFYGQMVIAVLLYMAASKIVAPGVSAAIGCVGGVWAKAGAAVESVRTAMTERGMVPGAAA